MSGESVKVIVRIRPMNEKEYAKNSYSVVDIDEKNNSMQVNKPNDPDGSKQFTFDFIFTPKTSQQYIYEHSAFPLVESVVEGYNGTMFAYGQTGCGKTYTMMGDPSDEIEKGIIPRSFNHIVNIIDSTQNNKYLVRCSYIEIYNEEVHDLLGKDVKQRMELKESVDRGLFIKDLTMIIVKNVTEMEKYMIQGTKNRATGETQMNKDSSRSHSIFTLYIESSSKTDKNQELIKAGKLNMVDLAGSERQSKTQATGDRLKEGSKINLSLSALGNVISALVDGKTSHIPYRDSKLTRLLQDSLGGNTKTIMLAAASPADYNYEETISTLRYASRAKFIKNKPIINEDPKDAMLKEYAEEIQKLKELLKQQQTAGGNGSLDNRIQNGTNQGQEPLVKQKDQMKKNQEYEKLSKENQQLNKQQEEFQKQMKEKEEAVLQEKKERERMELMIKELEQKTIQGGKADDDQKKKFKQMQSKFKNYEKEQEKLRQEKEQKENELVFMEKNYQNLQDEVDGLRQIIKSLRQKYKQSLNDIRDVNYEQEQARGELLETIRTQEKEIKLFQSMVKMMLSHDEIDQIRGASEYNEEANEYKVPCFYFKEKTVKFPKLPFQQAIDLIQNEKDSRELSFKNTKTKIFKSTQENQNQEFADFREQKKKNYNEKTENFDSSMDMKVREVRETTSQRQDDKKFRNNNFSNMEKNQQKEVERKAQPKVVLEPLSAMQVDGMQDKIDRLERQNNSSSLPPNVHNHRAKSNKFQGIKFQPDLILKPLQNEQINKSENQYDIYRKPPRNQKLDRIDYS